MASLKAAIYSILQADAKLNTAANLGSSAMLNKSTVAPYGVYYHHPPAEPVAPFLTYHVGTAAGDHPRMTEVRITAWGGEIVTIQNRIYALLDHVNLGSLTDYRFLLCKWDWNSEEMWDEDLQIYVRDDRYLVTLWKS